MLKLTSSGVMQNRKKLNLKSFLLASLKSLTQMFIVNISYFFENLKKKLLRIALRIDLCKTVDASVYSVAKYLIVCDGLHVKNIKKTSHLT